MIALDYASASAHPRVSGENGIKAAVGDSLRGSSPRERGKLFSRRWVPWWDGAHPRVSGENAGAHHSRLGQHGSSPRERGKHQLVKDCAVDSRLIPA